VIGVSAGRLGVRAAGITTRPAASLQARTAPPAFRAPVAGYNAGALNGDIDEAFLSEVENAVSQQRIAALRALDAMTPRVQDAVARAK
jgi:hypothetical protein